MVFGAIEEGCESPADWFEVVQLTFPQRQQFPSLLFKFFPISFIPLLVLGQFRAPIMNSGLWDV